MTSTLFNPAPGALHAHLFQNTHIGLPLTLFYRIDLPLQPFDFDGGEQKTSVRLDFIQLPVSSWRQLPGRVFHFPVNPEEGYIDGSLYLGHAHNPADVTRIAFRTLDGSELSAEIEMRIDFELEGPPELGIVQVAWPVELHVQPTQLDDLMREADRLAARR